METGDQNTDASSSTAAATDLTDTVAMTGGGKFQIPVERDTGLVLCFRLTLDTAMQSCKFGSWSLCRISNYEWGTRLFGLESEWIDILVSISAMQLSPKMSGGDGGGPMVWRTD